MERRLPLLAAALLALLLALPGPGALLAARRPPASPPAPSPAPADAAPELLRALDDLSRRAGTPDGLVPLLQALEVADVRLGRPTLDAFLVALAQDPGTHPLVRGHAWIALASRDRARGDRAAASVRLARAGFAPDWEVIGPFENYGDAEFETSLAPERGECEGGCEERGRPVAWRTFAGLPILGRIDLADLFEESTGKVAYARVFAHVPKATAAAVRVGADDGISVFVGGSRVLHDPTHKPAAPDQRVTSVSLKAGWNEVVAKVGQDDGAWAFYLRLTAPDGAPLPDLKWAVRPAGVRPSPTLAAAPPPGPRRVEAPADPFALLEARAAADPREYRARLDLAELTRLLRREDRHREVAAAWAREAVALRPDAAEAWWTLARCRLSDPDERRRALERAVALDPSLTRARAALAEVHEQAGRLDVSRPMVREGVIRDPSDPDFARLHGDRLDGVSAQEASLALWKRVADAHPFDTGPLQRAAWRARELDRHGEAEALLRRAWDLDRGDAGLARSLADSLVELGRAEEARVLLDAARDLRPHSAQAALSWADAMLRLGFVGEARANLERQAARHPGHARLLQRLGDARDLDGDREGALSAWRGSLALRPENPELRAWLDRVAGGPDPMQRAWARDPETLPPARGDPSVYEGRGARVLLDLQVTRVHGGGQASRFHQVVIRVDRDEAGRDLRTRTLAFDDELEDQRVLVAEVIKPDGQRPRARSIQERSYTASTGGMYGQVSYTEVAFDPPKAGDLVHLQWRRDARGGSNRFDDFFGEVARLQGSEPVTEATYVLVTPEGMEVHDGGMGAPPAEVRREGGEVVRTWRMTDLPALPSETAGPGYFDVGAFVSVSNFATWERVARWWAQLIAPQFYLGPEGEALARQVTAGATTTREKVRAVYEYVARNTHYIGLEFGIHGWKPYAARQVLDRKFGDCKDKSILMSAMLAAVGVPTEMVILSTTGRGRPPASPPNLFYFNHAIAYVPELDLYLDATAELAPLESLRWDDQGAMALRVDRQGGADLVMIPVSPPEENASDSRVEVRLDEHGNAEFREHWTERGIAVPQLRKTYQDPARWAERIQKEYDERLPGVHVEAATVAGAQDLAPELVFDIHARVPGFGEVRGDRLSVPTTPFPDLWGDSVAGASTRETDVVFQGTNLRELQVRVIPPGGYAPASLPAPVRVEGPHLVYERTCVREGDGVVVRERFVRDAPRVPAAAYADFRRAALAMDRAQAERIRFVRKGGGEPPAGPTAGGEGVP